MLACCCVTLPSAASTELGTPLPRPLGLFCLRPGLATWMGVEDENESRGPASSRTPMSSVRPSLIDGRDWFEISAGSSSTIALLDTGTMLPLLRTLRVNSGWGSVGTGGVKPCSRRSCRLRLSPALEPIKL